MKKSILIILVIIILVLCCCLSSGLIIFLLSSEGIFDTGTTSSTITPSPAATTTTEEDTLLFESKEYGFTLKLPASWEGYDVFGGKGTEASEVEYLYNFSYEGTSPMEVYAFSVAIYDKDTWETVKDYEYNQGAKIAENDSYIYAMSNDAMLPADVYAMIKDSFQLSEE